MMLTRPQIRTSRDTLQTDALIWSIRVTTVLPVMV
jgi:hypothetical protein